MADSAMSYEEALNVLTKMKNAAPAVAKTKLSGVLALLEAMHQREQVAESKPSTVEAEKADPAASDSRQRSSPPQKSEPVRSAPMRLPLGKTIDDIFQDFDPEQFSIESMPAGDSRPGIARSPDTSELFADLPEFQPQREVDPRDFTLDTALGIDQAASPSGDLLAVMGLDEEPKPVPDLFADMPSATDDEAPLRELLTSIAPDLAPPAEAPPERTPHDLRTRSQLLKRVEAGALTSEIGVEDVIDMLREPEQAPEQPQDAWNATAVLRDLEVERSSSALWDETAALFAPEAMRDTSEFDRLMGWDAAAPVSGAGDDAPQPPRFGATDRLEQAAWNADYQPPPLESVFDGGVSADGGVVPDEYAVYDADAVGGQEALDNLVAFAMGEAPERGSEGDLPGATALLTNVREVLKPSLLLLHAQTELLRERAVEALDERDAEMVRLMHDNADMALTLLESLEMVMQLSENALDLNITAFSALDLLRDAGERMQDRARLYRHRITVMLDRRLPPLRADYRRTLAILVDLMDNAVRYTPEGGTSRIAVDHLGGCVLFTVADNGIGLSDADMAYIGQPFWRALHQPLVRAHRGTGLRLYLARRVLEMQGGALFFSGEPNAGSTFSFTVPVAAGD